MNYSTDLSVVKTELARELKRALVLRSTQMGDLRELGAAVYDTLHALEFLEAAPDKRSSVVVGVLVKYGHYDLTAEEVELLVRVSESEL